MLTKWRSVVVLNVMGTEDIKPRQKVDLRVSAGINNILTLILELQTGTPVLDWKRITAEIQMARLQFGVIQQITI